MSNYAHAPTPAEIKPAIEECYGLSVVDIVPLDGYAPRNFKIVTDEKSYFLKRYPLDKEASARFHISVYSHFLEQGFPVAPIIPMSSGATGATGATGAAGEKLMMLSEYPHIMQGFIEAPLLSAAPMNEVKMVEAGGYLAKLHNCGGPPGAECPYVEHNWNIENFSKIIEIYQTNRSKIPEEGLAGLDRAISDWSSAGIDFSNLSRTFIHNDFHQDNLLFNENNCVGIIDFSESMPGAAISDIAIALHYIAFWNDSPEKWVKPFLEGYLGERTIISAEEFQYLPALIRARAATSYLMNFLEQGRVQSEALNVLNNQKVDDACAI